MQYERMLLERYGVSLPEEAVSKNTLSMMNINPFLTRKEGENFDMGKLLLPSETQQMRLVAIVVSEYSLLGTNSPVGITLTHTQNGKETTLAGNNRSFLKHDCHDVLMPTCQFDSTKVWFKAANTKMSVVRTLFPHYTEKDLMRGIIKLANENENTWFLSIETEMNADGKIMTICPMGVVIQQVMSKEQVMSKDDEMIRITEAKYINPKTGRESVGYYIAESHAENLQKHILQMISDPRPLVDAKTLKLTVNSCDVFSLYVSLDIFYCEN
jgi:hypothetical protein